MHDQFEPVIGIEIHIELKTNTKMFCSCPVSFGEAPNTHCCPVCMGYPGTLPLLNKKAIEFAIMAGISLNCTIEKYSCLSRKNYFYPDLPKGYQITQSSYPICKNGFIIINNKKIRIKRVHIEEDAGKLIHNGSYSLIDHNRCGIPLIEIV